MLLCGLSTRCICVLITEICLVFGSRFYIWQQISEVCMNKLPWESVEGRALCTPSRNETAGLVGLQVFLRHGGNPVGHLHWPLGLRSSFFIVCVWSYWYGFLLCPIQPPNEPSWRNFSSALQTSNELAHSRCFIESKLLSIKRDFKGLEPAVDFCGFHPFTLQQHYSKEVSIDFLSPFAHIQCFPQTPPAYGESPTHWNCSG